MANTKSGVGFINRHHPLAINLASAYLFDRGYGSGLGADAMGQNHVTSVGTAPTYSTTPWGTGAAFGGAGYLKKAYRNTLNFHSFTVAMRFRLDGNPGANAYELISLNDASNGYPYRLGLNMIGNTDGRAVFVAFDGSVTNSTTLPTSPIGTAGNVGKWFDLMATGTPTVGFSMRSYDATGGGLIEASGIGTDIMNETLITLDGGFTIGASSGGNDKAVVTIAHVLVWNRYMTEPEMAQIHEDPYGMFMPPRPMFLTSSGAPPPSSYSGRLLTLGVG